jgi:hypothetical protein
MIHPPMSHPERTADTPDDRTGVCDDRADEHRTTDLRRRTVLRGLVGAGGLAALPEGVAAQADDGPLGSGSEGAGEADPHTVATFRALVDALVPETPDVAAERGGEHEPGGLAIELERFLMYSFNSFVPVEPGGPENTGATLRAAETFAGALDEAASELLARNENDDAPTTTRFSAGGTFAALSRDDRLRAVELLEAKEVPLGSLAEEGSFADDIADYDGFVQYQVTGMNLVAMLGYYSEWAGYGETKTDCPTDRVFEGIEAVQSFEQTDYPGPARGYADLRGYEVQRFVEDEY